MYNLQRVVQTCCHPFAAFSGNVNDVFQLPIGHMVCLIFKQNLVVVGQGSGFRPPSLTLILIPNPHARVRIRRA